MSGIERELVLAWLNVIEGSPAAGRQAGAQQRRPQDAVEGDTPCWRRRAVLASRRGVCLQGLIEMLQKEDWLAVVLPGSAACIRSHPYTHPPITYASLLVLCLSLPSYLCLSLVHTYHTGRLEGSGGQECLGHGQAQERDQERKRLHGCVVCLWVLKGTECCVSGDWTCGGDSFVSNAAGQGKGNSLLGLG